MSKKRSDLQEQKYNVRDAATRLGVSQKTIYGLVESGALAHFRIGNGRG